MIPLDCLPDAVVVAGPTGQIQRVNQRAEELFGYASSELVGQPLEMLIPEKARERHRQHRQAYVAAPAVRPMGRGMLSALHRTGREIPVEIMLSPNPDGSVVAVVRDVTRRRDLERFRDQYVGYVSHDLKNPLGVILLQARLLAGQLAARRLIEERHAVDVIAESASLIDRLVRELLEMSYLESERVELRREPHDLVPFLKAVLERTVSTSDRLRLRLEVHDEVTAAVDTLRIERVVANFVHNAFKYAPGDSPIVIRLRASDEMAIVSVEDRGPGMSAAEAALVFDKYHRAPSARTREGLGLGLYICRLIVEAHGGRIGVDARPAQGSTFYFEVPRLPSRHERLPYNVTLDAPVEDPRLHDIRGVRVLVVDDAANAVSALTALLAEEGLQAAGATSSDRALEVALEHRPEVVLLDVEMPDVPGPELLGRLRDRIPGLPAIVMSGHLPHHPAVVATCSEPATMYLGKPVRLEELMVGLRRMVLARSG